jgi:multicomponent Na+:H+ antiporter subunit B
MNIIVRAISNFLIPFILVFGFYIQINGESSPGGGFQSGVIFALLLISINIVNEKQKTLSIFSEKNLIIIGAFGMLIYCITGIFSIFFGLNFLNYNFIYYITKFFGIDINSNAAQGIGIFIIEIGIGMTVFATMYLIFLVIKSSIYEDNRVNNIEDNKEDNAEKIK